MTGTTIVLLVVGILVAAIGFVVVLMFIIFRFFSHLSGWRRLVERYHYPQGPVGTLHRAQTVKVGPVRWRWSMTVGLSDHGLYLSPSPPIGPLRSLVSHAPVLIPWSELYYVGPGTIYFFWRVLGLCPCTELAIGNPRITSLTMPDVLYARLAPWLQGRQ